MAVKRRIIWMSDAEWAQLGQIAKERGDTISAVIRDFWQVASKPIAPNLGWDPLADLPARPFTPAPKPGKGK